MTDPSTPDAVDVVALLTRERDSLARRCALRYEETVKLRERLAAYEPLEMAARAWLAVPEDHSYEGYERRDSALSAAVDALPTPDTPPTDMEDHLEREHGHGRRTGGLTVAYRADDGYTSMRSATPEEAAEAAVRAAAPHIERAALLRAAKEMPDAWAAHIRVSLDAVRQWLRDRAAAAQTGDE
jgi:hypothetical protein